MKHKQIHDLVTAALCIALGVALPQALHMIPQAGVILLPMHFPVLLCGLICGWQYGLICGLLTPALSSLLTGMPVAAYLPGMVCELAVYGLVAGLMVQLVRTKNPTFNIYAQLVTAMLLGRVVYGLTNAFIFQAGAYTFQIFFAAAFVTALPGIVLQLVILPPMIMLLKKARQATGAVAVG